MRTFHLRLPWPPTVNHYYKRNTAGGIYLSPAGRVYRDLVVCKLRSRHRLEGRLGVEIIAYPPNDRKRDLDNLLKPALDAMEAAKVYLDDGQIDILTIRRGPVSSPSYLEVEVTEWAHNQGGDDE